MGSGVLISLAAQTNYLKEHYNYEQDSDSRADYFRPRTPSGPVGCASARRPEPRDPTPHDRPRHERSARRAAARACVACARGVNKARSREAAREANRRRRHRNRLRSSRLANRHRPWPSLHRHLMRSPLRPRKTNRWPQCGSRFNVSCTISASPSKPLRMSVCPVASHTRTPAGIGIIAATAP